MDAHISLAPSTSTDRSKRKVAKTGVQETTGERAARSLCVCIRFTELTMLQQAADSDSTIGKTSAHHHQAHTKHRISLNTHPMCNIIWKMSIVSRRVPLPAILLVGTAIRIVLMRRILRRRRRWRVIDRYSEDLASVLVDENPLLRLRRRWRRSVLSSS